MSDQFGNTVDKEVWAPLQAGDWIDKVEIGSVKDGSQKPPVFVPLDSWTEWALAYADGTVDEERYKKEGDALQALQFDRRHLKEYGIPEEYWPVLMERTVEIVSSSWRITSV